MLASTQQWSAGPYVVHMLCLAALFLKLVACAPVDGSAHGKSLGTTVDLGYAKYQGTALSSGVNQWLGMRYAAAPLGNLRWRAPQDPVQQSGVQEATQFGPLCIGVGNPSNDSEDYQEDCLFIDVFAPSNATTESKLPVWFFIQGGGYADNSNGNYNGTEVVMQSNYSMVFVELNYRVGSFGFLASKDVQEDGNLNVGLLDQEKALYWVQKYIHLFGGNPEHVVIHGDSAGGGSIAYHLTAYGGRNEGLFVGAIAESPFLPTHRTVAQSEFLFQRYTAAVGCGNNTSSNSSSSVMACLRSKNTATLQAADVDSPFPGSSVVPDWSFLPVIDGTFSQELLYTQFEQGQIVRVPIMVGDDTDEGTDFAPNVDSSEQFLQFIQANYPLLTPADLEAINRSYPLGTPFPLHNPWFTPAEAAYGESTFICPGIEMTSSIARYLSPSKAWNYHYNVSEVEEQAAGIGVSHVSELPAILGPGNAGACTGGCLSFETYNAPIVPVIMSYWISFILSLDPNTFKDPSAPVWEPWGPSGNQRLKFQLGATQMEQVPQDQQQRCALWKCLADTTQQ